MGIIITDSEHRQQVEDFISYRHRLERKPNTPSKYDGKAMPLRVKLDAKLSDMSDEKWIASMQNFGG